MISAAANDLIATFIAVVIDYWFIIDTINAAAVANDADRSYYEWLYYWSYWFKIIIGSTTIINEYTDDFISHLKRGLYQWSFDINALLCYNPMRACY